MLIRSDIYIYRSYGALYVNSSNLYIIFCQFDREPVQIKQNCCNIFLFTSKRNYSIPCCSVLNFLRTVYEVPRESIQYLLQNSRLDVTSAWTRDAADRQLRYFLIGLIFLTMMETWLAGIYSMLVHRQRCYGHENFDGLLHHTLTDFPKVEVDNGVHSVEY